MQHIPQYERTAFPCSRFISHMKRYSASRNFLPFPERASSCLRLYNKLSYQRRQLGPMVKPFTAIGLCRSTSQKASAQKSTCRTSSEPKVEETVAATEGSLCLQCDKEFVPHNEDGAHCVPAHRVPLYKVPAGTRKAQFFVSLLQVKGFTRQPRLWPKDIF
ncbi:uncharacterized protein C12orf42 homolog [Nannospalax galili]|uniref:uncharacterized protein C12orf42 homolog n=1 Tax=Nannospalax galili TaxID=1026970 RepID=UPI00111C5146|nr:uncharacterized protein C12orf42 homolog [Nannospalax galili]